MYKYTWKEWNGDEYETCSGLFFSEKEFDDYIEDGYTNGFLMGEDDFDFISEQEVKVKDILNDFDFENAYKVEMIFRLVYGDKNGKVSGEYMNVPDMEKHLKEHGIM